MVVPRADSLPPIAGLSFSQGGAVGVKPCSSLGGRGSAGQNTGLVGPPGEGAAPCAVCPGLESQLSWIPGLQCLAQQGVPSFPPRLATGAVALALVVPLGRPEQTASSKGGSRRLGAGRAWRGASSPRAVVTWGRGVWLRLRPEGRCGAELPVL